MSIPMVEKHTFGINTFLQPSDVDEDTVRDVIYKRERFSSVTDLIHRIDRIDEADFSDATNKYFISANHINDAYLAVIAIYWSVADKLPGVGGIIMIDENERVMKLAGMTDTISIQVDADNADFLNNIMNPNNPVLHIVGSASEISQDILLDDRVEFFICCGAGNSDHAVKPEDSCCCKCVTIEAESSDDAKAVFTDYLSDRLFSYDNVEKQIDSLTKSLKSRDEYYITAAARHIVSNHLFNDPDDRELAPEDFEGAAELFGSKTVKKTSASVPLVGLEREVGKIKGILDSVRIDKMRFDQGISSSFNGCSMVFAGPPGTAKTTLARMFASSLAEMGVIKDASCFKECNKSDYVGQYLGHTAAKVDGLFSQMVEKGGGVIFFDEIYTLSGPQATSYDNEAVTSIIQNMENHRDKVFCIFAGYEDKMNGFLACNPGLHSRISFTVKFEAYSDNTLCEIFRSIAAADNYKLPADCGEELSRFFKKLRRVRGEHFGNGREARNLFVNAKQKHAVRLGYVKKISAKMLTALCADDIAAAAEDILSSELSGSTKRATIGF